MTFLRRIGLLVSALFFCACLVVFTFLVGIHSIFSTPQPLKTALQDSGIYGEITPNITASQMTALSLPPQDIGIKKAFNQALPATFYQHASEQIIDGTYGWMQGRTAAPEFSVGTVAVKSNFAQGVAAYVHQQMDSLPVCDRDVAPPVSAKDALSLTCLPKHVTPDDVAGVARQQILAAGMFGGSDAITAASLKDGQGRTLTEQLAFLPGLYRAYVPVLVMLPILAVLTALAVVFWSAAKRAGLRRVAWMLLSVGLVGLVLSAAGIELFHMGVRIFGLPLTLAFETQDKLVGAIELLAIGARPWWLGISAGYVLLGTALLVTQWLRRPKQTLRFSD